MKAAGQWFVIGVLAVLSGWCLAIAAGASEQLRKTERFAEIILQVPMKMQEADMLMENAAEDDDVYQLVFISEEKDRRVEWPAAGRNAKADVLAVGGQTNLLSEDNQWLIREDREGCLISADIAKALMGSSKMVGEELTIGAKTYIVRGILKKLSGCIITAPDEQTEFGRVRIKVPDGQTAARVKEMVGNKNGISGTLLEYSLLYQLAVLSLWLLPLCIFTSFLLWLRSNRKHSRITKEKFIWIGLSLAAVILFCWMARGLIAIPRDMIPSKWSDFSFWVRLFEDKTAAIKFLLSQEKTVLDGGYLGMFVKAAGFGILSVVLYFLMIICYTMQRIAGR